MVGGSRFIQSSLEWGKIDQAPQHLARMGEVYLLFSYNFSGFHRISTKYIYIYDYTCMI